MTERTRRWSDPEVISVLYHKPRYEGTGDYTVDIKQTPFSKEHTDNLLLLG